MLFRFKDVLGSSLPEEKFVDSLSHFGRFNNLAHWLDEDSQLDRLLHSAPRHSVKWYGPKSEHLIRTSAQSHFVDWRMRFFVPVALDPVGISHCAMRDMQACFSSLFGAVAVQPFDSPRSDAAHSLFPCHLWLLPYSLSVETSTLEQTPNTKRSRVDNSAAISVSSQENCIQNIGESGAKKPKSLLNCFLVSVQSVVQQLDDHSVPENFFEFLRGIVEVCWSQCQVSALDFSERQVVFTSPAVFSDRKRKRESADESIESESIPHFYLVILDLVQILLGGIEKVSSFSKYLRMSGVACVLEQTSRLCDYSVTNNCLVVWIRLRHER